MKTIKASQVRSFILENAGTEPFHVRFIKRSTGEVREMRAQLGVVHNLKGVGLAYDPESKGLMSVWDVDKQGYRMINFDGLQEVRVGDETYRVVE